MRDALAKTQDGTVPGRGNAESFRFQISKAIPESQLVAWFEQAQPGERVEYCEGYVELRDDAAWKLAGAWARAGLVHLVTERVGAKRVWLVEKRPAKNAVVKASRAVDAAAQLAERQLDALLEMFVAAACKGERCPTLTAQARSVIGQDGRRARNRVTYLRKRLEAQGRIAVAPGAHDRPPVVTILTGRHSGKSTRRMA